MLQRSGRDILLNKNVHISEHEPEDIIWARALFLVWERLRSFLVFRAQHGKPLMKALATAAEQNTYVSNEDRSGLEEICR